MALELMDVHKSYRVGRRDKPVLRGVTARIGRGDSIGILGRNGSGKSTLVRLIAGVEQPTQGRIRRGMSISWPLGMGAGFLPTLTGADNVRFIARIYGKSPERTVEFVESFAELGSYMRMPMSTYSAGMRIRLLMAVSLAVEFDCYLVDEALAVGDARFGQAIMERIRRGSLILVTHQPTLVRTLCQRAAILDGGILTIFDDIDEALATYNAL